MDKEEERILKKIRARQNVIFKYGTYTMDDPSSSVSSAVADPSSALDADFVMPPRTEDFIQNSIDSMFKDSGEVFDSHASVSDNSTSEFSDEDAKIAEILNKFSSNIQNNVNSLFDNVI